jgi:long-chain acyl-CoA synthetase
MCAQRCGGIGYGLTESCGTVCILPPEFMRFGVAGVPVPSVEIKFLDVPEAGYKSQGNPPQGEHLLSDPKMVGNY